MYLEDKGCGTVEGIPLLDSVFFLLNPLPLYFFKPQHFKGWFFPRLQVKPTLLGPVDQASLYQSTDGGPIEASSPENEGKTIP
jgi:hypothetical protein